ncbi:DUF5655 domain-containing protein [Streptomyces sp. RPT161]|uniref:DUF5655 domain-containing protein n=1 Tax=Streptomyces sp. RPT161 TaxID=3015993 RepID=UPI0022B8E0D2|nr:DUF5655 domain-containing protein [Streptomyces sp. RPT161]
MTDLKLFRLDDEGRDVEMRGSTAPLERDLQRRIEAGMEAMLGIRFLASEYPTGPWHRGRVDSLGLDENGTPVVIEYKKASHAGVVSQAVSYLSWLKSARHEFHALVKERLGDDAAESIDWRTPRVVCIASDFYQHDRIAVRELGKRIDLVRYRLFDGGLLSLLLVESVSGSAEPVSEPSLPDRGVLPSAGGGGRTVLATLYGAPSSLRALYDELHEVLTASGEVEVEAKLHYIAYRRMVNVACVQFRPAQSAIVVYLKLDPDSIDLEDGFTRDMRGVGHHGTGDLQVRITSAAALEKATPLIQRAFEAA